MVLKKIAILFMAFMVMCSGITVVCAQNAEPIAVTNETRTVEINAKTVQYEGTVVAIAAWYPDYSRADFGKYDVEKINAYTGEATVNAENMICKTFTLKESAPSGEYTLDLYVPGEAEPVSHKFVYRNVVAAAATLQTAKTGSKEQIKTALDNSIKDVSVEAGLHYLTYSNEVRAYIAANIANNRPADEPALIEQLLEEVNIINTVKELSKKADDRLAMKTMLEANPALFKISEYMSDYNSLTDEKREEMYTNLSTVIDGCVFPEDVAKVFSEALKAVMPEEDSDDDDDDRYYGSGGGGGGGGSGKGSVSLRTDASIAPVATNAPAPEDSFADISGHWAANPIKILASKGIINGKTEDSFCPNDTIKKEEFLKLIMSALDLKAPSAVPLPFKDVEYNTWYYDYVHTAYVLGISNGMSDSQYGIGTQISRQDMAVLLYKACALEGKAFGESNVTFKDEEEISDYAKAAVSALAGGNIISGRDDGSFDPKATATRAEAVKIIYEALYKFGLL